MSSGTIFRLATNLMCFIHSKTGLFCSHKESKMTPLAACELTLDAFESSTDSADMECSL